MMLPLTTILSNVVCFQEMPCGLFIRRRDENGFRKEYPQPLSAEASYWLAYLEHSQQLEIQHNRNGVEHQSGPKKIPVDGYCR